MSETREINKKITKLSRLRARLYREWLPDINVDALVDEMTQNITKQLTDLYERREELRVK
jgi:hypothetical protein